MMEPNAKTKLGLPLFDETYGGVYTGRSSLCWGRKGSGKTVLGVHFINRCVSDGGRGLIITNRLAGDVLIIAGSLGMPLNDATRDGRVIMLEYANLISESTAGGDFTLPPQAFMELQEIIETRSISCLLIDDALPWVAIESVERLGTHVFSFIKALERFRVTSLLTLPQPASAAAFMLRDKLQEFCPVSIGLDRDDSGRRGMVVDKYLGHFEESPRTSPFEIRKGRGIVGLGGAAGSPGEPGAAEPALPSPQPALPSPEPGGEPERDPEGSPRRNISFANAFRNKG